MSTINLGRVGFVNKGTYLQSTAYKVNDVVISGSTVYACVIAHTSPSSGITLADWTVWVTSDGLVPADIGVTVQGYDATILKSADIDSTVQGYDADTSKLDVAETRTASINMGGNALSNSNLTVSSYTGIADTSVATGGTHTFNYSLGDMQQLTATGGFTVAFSNFTTGKVCSMVVDAINWGSYQINYPIGTIFAAATAPVLTASGTDRLIVLKDKDDVFSIAVAVLDIR